MKRIFLSHIRASISIFAVIVATLGFTFGSYYQFIYIDGDSMSYTLDDGQWVIVERWKDSSKISTLCRYDIIVAKWGTKKMIGQEKIVKRVIGLPGDVIKITDGYIFLNGKVLENFHGHGRLVQYTPQLEYETHEPTPVPDGKIWVIGDNRTESHYGLVPVEDIVGRVIW